MTIKSSSIIIIIIIFLVILCDLSQSYEKAHSILREIEIVHPSQRNFQLFFAIIKNYYFSINNIYSIYMHIIITRQVKDIEDMFYNR